jgi:hypothetical protein
MLPQLFTGMSAGAAWQHFCVRTLICLAPLYSVMGCSRQDTPAPQLQSGPQSGPITSNELNYAKSRMKLLKSSMTEEQVLATLGLSRFKPTSVHSEGPRSAYWSQFSFEPSVNLQIWIGESVPEGTNRCVSVRLDGVTWPPPAKNEPSEHPGF